MAFGNKEHTKSRKSETRFNISFGFQHDRNLFLSSKH